ncbi:MAG: hypothetical protein RLZZ127_201 [Planctomycetota bacterium]|jgi:CheY-like chemotaxis protein
MYPECMERLRILVVDDEPRIVDGLQRVLRPMRDRVEVLTATAGEAALDLMARTPVHTVMSDMRMPGMDGATLLDRVADQHPDTTRIILSGQCDVATVCRCVGATHRFLSKPCDPGVLKATIDDLVSARAAGPGPVVRAALCRLRAVPAGPDLEPFRAAVDGGDPAAAAQAAARDPGIALRLLQLVGTWFFGPPRPVCDPAVAVRSLGVDLLRPLLAAGAFPGGGPDPRPADGPAALLAQAAAAAGITGPGAAPALLRLWGVHPRLVEAVEALCVPA